MAILTILCVTDVTNTFAADFTPSQIVAPGGTTIDNIQVSSSFTSTSEKQLCSSQKKVEAVSISSSANGNYDANYVQIQASTGSIGTLSVQARGNSDGTDKFAVAFWEGDASNTPTAYSAYANIDRSKDNCDGYVSISMPDNIKTIRIYRLIKIKDGAFNGSGSEIGSSTTCNIFGIIAMPSCAATAPGDIGKGALVGSTITLTAAGEPAENNTWYWQTAADGTAQTESGATKNVTAAGTYYIRSYYSTDDCWSAAKSIEVTAEDFLMPSSAPTIISHPVSATYEAGETVTPLSVSATGSGTLSYQWQKDGVNIEGANSNTYLPTVSGSYTCIVTNTEVNHKPTSVTSNEATLVIQTNTYLLQGISGSTGTGVLTGDFFTTASCTQNVSVTYDGINYSKAVKFAGNVTSITSNNYPDRMIRYDCKTTLTEFTIVAFANSNGKKMYVGDIKESAIGSNNTVTDYTTVDLTNGSITTTTYTINSSNPASLYVSVGSNSNAFIVQIIAEEKGTPLPIPGSIGYKLNHKKTRVVARSGDKVWLDSKEFEYCSNENVTAGSTEKIKMQTKGTNYIQFRSLQSSIIEVGIDGIGKGFYIADNKEATLNATFYPATLGSGIHEVAVGAGLHYLVPNGSNMYVSSLNFVSAAVAITYDANGGFGSMSPQIVPQGAEIELNENEYVWTNHLFLGWTEDPAGTGELIQDGDLYTAETDITLYAQWEELQFATITLDATGAYNNYTKSVVATTTLPMPEIATLPLRVGYVFDGYYDKPNGAGTQYYNGLGESARNWDKAVTECTLYAKWLTPCELEPTLTNITPIVTIWDKQKADVGIVRLTCEFDTTGIGYVLQSVEPANPIEGCRFEYFDEQIHLMGIPDLNNTTTQTVTVTFTMANSCTPASLYTITQTIRIYPENTKPKIAFILTGTKGGAFTAYSEDDKAACNNLLDYLDDFYDITCVNGYATKDPTQIAEYYSQYDLLIVTDFLNTHEGYTNAIGTLIDKKPILSFEAYAANLSNWHIGSNPKDPNPPVGTMKVLCAGHSVFGDAEGVSVFNKDEHGVSDTTITVLGSLSEKGLQGFLINEAPDFIFLATVRDTANNRDLIVCCERQIVFPARLLIYGINHNEMGNLTPAGKVVMHQMIDYLLMTDETKIADCSLVFDNNDGDHKWSNPKNWAPGYNIVPTPFHPTRIIAECHVDVANAHAGSVKINKGRDEHGQLMDGKVIVKPYGGLTVAGIVQKVNDTRYASPFVIKAEDLLIEADENNNGAFVYGNKESNVRATVQYYSLGKDAKTANPVWQYIGVPFQAGQTAITMYYKAWMCRWASGSTDNLGGLWQWVDNEDVLVPFEGYCITQEAKKTYTFAGKLNMPVTKTLVLDNRDIDGYAFAANSWTAPIKIQEMQDADFINAEKSIYLYHSGTYAEWEANHNPDEAGQVATLPGQYAVVPIHASPYLAGADSVIPAMQGFFIKTTSSDAMLKLVYNRVVYDSKYFTTSTQPMRAPRRVAQDESGLQVMRLMLAGEHYGDQLYLLSHSDFSEQYEDGWDGRKLQGTDDAPYLSFVKNADTLAVAAIASADNRELLFRAGMDEQYTFSFDYDGETIYLYDRLTDQATEIKTGNTYTFTAENRTPAKRFLITTNPPRIPTGIENTEDKVQNTDVEKCIIDGQLYIIKDNRFYDARGVRVSSLK